ncbi:hypothetical protein Dimus_019237 [Dionaea muscipula]
MGAFAASIFVGIWTVWIYRATHDMPFGEGEGEDGHLQHHSCRMMIKWAAWMGLFVAELWFGLYWILTQALRGTLFIALPSRIGSSLIR